MTKETPQYWLQRFTQEEASQITGWAHMLYDSPTMREHRKDDKPSYHITLLVRQRVMPIYHGDDHGIWGFKDVSLAASYAQVLSRCTKYECEPVALFDEELELFDQPIQILLPPLPNGETKRLGGDGS